MSDILKPHGRTAYNHVNKENQAWAQKKVWVEGKDVFGNRKKFLVENGHFRCGCGEIVFVRKGFAICDGCGLCFNDGPIETSEKIKRQAEGAFRRKCINKSFI
jgi:hypothetical protein